MKREKTERQKLKESSKLKPSTSIQTSSNDEDEFVSNNPPPSLNQLPDKDGPDTASTTSGHSGSEIVSQISKPSLLTPSQPSSSSSNTMNDTTLPISSDKDVLHWGKLKKKKKFAATRGQFSTFYFVLKTDGYLYYYHVSLFLLHPHLITNRILKIL